MTDIVQKLWNFCNILRDDGMHYGDYIEQLTYLLFLKMADEKGVHVPKEYGWKSMLEVSGTALIEHYEITLKELGKQTGVLGDIFAQSNNKFKNPVHLSQLIMLINDYDWSSVDLDVKGAAYEGLLQKFAAEQKGAGQYFTPRELIRAIVKCVDPKHNETIHDPACGTGGFLIGAFEHIFNKVQSGNKSFSREDWEWLQKKAISGAEIVWDTRRLCIMNLYLHEVEAQIYFGDALKEKYGEGFKVIVTNPPFGVKSGGQTYSREDFTVQTSNKQLNFLQHCMSILAAKGRSAMVMPDNVLFEDGAGQKIRKILLDNYNLHTILRLPNGTFTPYAAGVKANVIFFDKTGKQTDETWVYDLRTNMPNINKGKPLTADYFNDFVLQYSNRSTETERWHRFTYEDMKNRAFNLDISWLKDQNLDDGTNLPEPEVLIAESIISLKQALNKLVELQNEI